MTNGGRDGDRQGDGRRRFSPVPVLLVVALVAVLANAGYVTTQLSLLRSLQTDLLDRNRRNSLQLLRIQDDLNSLALAMRDMLDNEEPYPLTAWSSQFERIRGDLDDALQREAALAARTRSAEQRDYLNQAVRQFWDASDRIFALAASGQADAARAQIRNSLQARQAALSTAVARLLVQNNEAEEATAAQVQGIYQRVQQQVYLFVAATLSAILLTGLFLIRANRRLFAALATLSEERRQLAQQLITARESTLREISRELHDDLGQTLTAIGSLAHRAWRTLPEPSPLRPDLHEIQQIAQATLDRVRSLSQTLHPSVLEDGGLETAIAWYVSTVDRQSDLVVSYERRGRLPDVDSATGIHIYRVLQEALSNVARHAGATRAWVRLEVNGDRLILEVEDRGRGLAAPVPGRGLGLVGMRERAAVIGGALQFLTPDEGGTLVRLTVPLSRSRDADGAAHGR